MLVEVYVSKLDLLMVVVIIGEFYDKLLLYDCEYCPDGRDVLCKVGFVIVKG